jgi:hypothetical protein
VKEDAMIYELRTYELKLGRLSDYLAIFETKGFPVLSRYAEPIGFWLSGPTETGFLDRVNHIWRYESVAGRIEQRTALYNDPAWIRELVPAVSETFARLRGQLMTLQPNTSERLETALASKTVKGPVVATVAPAGISPSGGGIGRWTTITGAVGQTFALDHLSEFDLEQREEPAGVERDIWRPARFSRIR